MDGRKDKKTNAQYSCEENESVLQCKNSEGHQTLVALVDWTQVILCHILHSTDTLDIRIICTVNITMYSYTVEHMRRYTCLQILM